MPLASSPSAPETQRLDVFISYSRSDIAFVERLVSALVTHDIDVAIDRRSLPMAVEFQPELLDLIRHADIVLFVLSPRSVASSWCAWEIDQVVELHKRLVPVVIEPTAEAQIPEAVRKINYVHFDGDAADGPGLDARVGELAHALKTNLPWTKEHTRIGDIARRWKEHGDDRSLLLRGRELEEAQAWQDRRPAEAPALSPAHVAFLAASRTSARSRQRRIVTGAIAAAAVMAGLAAVAYWQRGAAVTNAALATTNETRALAELSRTETARGDTSHAIQLAVQGMENAERAHVPPDAAETALYEALWRHRELRRRKLGVEPQDAWFDEQSGNVTVLTDKSVLTLDRDLNTVSERPRRKVKARNQAGVSLEERPSTEPQPLDAAWSKDGHVLQFTVPGQPGAVSSIAVERRAVPFTPKQAWLVRGGKDATAILSASDVTDLTERQLAIVAQSGVSLLHFAESDSLAIHRSGHIVAVCRPWGSGYFIDVDRADQQVPLQQYIKAATCMGYGRSVAYSEKRDMVVFIPSSNSGQIEQPMLVDASTGIERATLGGHSSSVAAIDVSPDGDSILTATDDGTVRLWQMLIGADPSLVQRHGGRVLDGTFATVPDEGRLVTSYASPAYTTLTGDGGFLKKSGGVYSVNEQARDDLVLASSDRELMVFKGNHLEAPVARAPLPAPLVDAVHRPGADHFFTADESGEIVRWSTTTQTSHPVLSTKPEKILALRWADASTDRLLIATTTRVLDVEPSTGRMGEVVQVPGGKADAVALLNGALSYCGTVKDDGTGDCAIISSTTKQVVARLPCQTPLLLDARLAVAFCPALTEGIPSLIDLADNRRDVSIFPDRRTIASTGLRSRAEIALAPIPGCRRAFISLGGGIADDLYRGEGLLYDFDGRREIARTKGDPSTDYQDYGRGIGDPVFCDRNALVGYARELLKRVSADSGTP